jgi:alkanesulfonate monooxygenase SsuD/methylene tetrahydromethanopterin reductase-like flavin-dependent oxidoreductase (luciferase family)
MRIGAIVLQVRPWSELAPVFRDVERLGFDVAYVADHLTHPTLPGRWLADGWVTLAAAAGVTSHVDLGTLVASAAYRTPVPLARLAATTADVTGGRFVLGLGAGSPHCAAADRSEHPTPPVLADRFGDLVEGLAHVWAGDAGWTGRVLGFDGVQTAPLPPETRRPHLMLAAHGPRSFDLVGRYADGWSSYGGPRSVALDAEDYWRLVTEQSSRVTEACERHGRNPTTLRRSLLLGYGRVRPLDSVPGFHDCLARAERAGFDELVVYWPDGQPGSNFWADPDVFAEAVGSVARG